MKIKDIFIILSIILNSLLVTKCDDLYDLNCFDERQCMHFLYPGLQSRCIEHNCECTTASGEKVKCVPRSYSMNNIIGGPCPCYYPTAECDVYDNVCYCAEGYVPTSDMRRCIKKKVAINEDCEFDGQCLKGDFNTFCNESTKKCDCRQHFILDEGRCVSAIAINFTCAADWQCTEKYGEGTKCAETTKHCLCTNGYHTVQDNTHCLNPSKYMENCIEDLQCMNSMGPGGRCIDNICQCSRKYRVVLEKVIEDELREMVCTRIIERGDYCRYEQDCYQHYLYDVDQTMTCIKGECDCKKGFNSHNERECVKGSSAGILTYINLSFMLGFGVLLFVIKCL